MKNKAVILFGIFGILVFIFLGVINFLNSNQQNNSNQAVQEENVISVQEEEGDIVPVQKEEIVKLDDKDIKERFKAIEIVSNNLPESIEFWTQAYCPGSGNKYDYVLSDSNSYYNIDSCSQGATGSHGGCETCIMSKIKLINDQEKVNEEFILAIKSNNIEKVKNLIKVGADVNIDFQVCVDVNIECEETIPLYIHQLVIL